VSHVIVMSSTVTVIFAEINDSAITQVVSNYNIRTELRFFERNRTKLIPNQIRVYFQKPNLNKNLFHTSLYNMWAATFLCTPM